MTKREAIAVVAALESGRRFTFSNYAADTREVLEHDAAAGRFVLTVQHGYDATRPERIEFTRKEMFARLRAGFSYESFGLPPAGGGGARQRGAE